MTTGATSQLGLALPVQGELSGTWGNTVNNGITQYTNIAIAATLTLTGDGAVTLANTTGDASASNITSTLSGAGTVTAQFAIVQVSGTTTTKVITGPSYSKTYVVDNASSYAVTFKASGQTGVSIAAAEKVTVFYNGTDYVKIAGTIANAAGSNTQIQFNNGGLFGASSSLTWDGSTFSTTGLTASGTTSLTGSATIFNSSTNTLSLQKNGGAASLLFGSNTAAYGQITSVLSGGLFFSTGDITQTEKMRITAAGDVGIGNSSPSYKLDVTGTLGVSGAITGNGNWTIGDADTDTITQNASYVNGSKLRSAKISGNTLSLSAYDVDGTAYTDLVTVFAGNTPTLELVSIGLGVMNNIAIGSTTAASGAFTTLSASGAVTLSGGTANGVAYLNGSKVLTSGSGLVFDGTNLGLGVTPSAWSSNVKALELSNGVSLSAFSGGTTPVLYLGANTYDNGTNNTYYRTAAASRYIQTAGEHRFYNAPSGTAGNAITFTQAMTLDSSGNLGIGTSSPSAKLHVKAGTDQNLHVSSGSSVLGLFAVNDAVTAPVSMQIQGSDLRFNTGSGSASERMRLDSAGNLGLGVTPSAWGSGFPALQLGNYGAFIVGRNNTNQLFLGSNAYFNGTNWIYSNTAASSRYYQSAASHVWDIAASGTAGNAITFTQAMTLDADGDLGIGTSSPANKLHVDAGSLAPTSGSIARFDTSATTAYSSGSFVGGQLRLNYGNATSSYGGINFSNSGATSQEFFGVVQNSSGYGNFVWQGYNGSYGERMRLDSSGNLGLGVTPQAWNSDTRMIDVGASVSMGNSYGGLASLVYNAVQSTASSGAWKYRLGASVAAGLYTVDSTHKWYTAGAGTAGNVITFTQAMTLDASGNLIVGGTTASYNASGRGLIQANGSSTALFGMSVGGTGIGYLASSSSAVELATSGANPLLFTTNAAERARIDSSGNLGLGVTPSAWVAGSKALQVGSAFGLRSTTSAGYEIYSNAYNNGTNDIYIATNYAAKYQTYNGQHLFFTAASGTAGNAITFTQAMTLDASGNLLVGLTSNGDNARVAIQASTGNAYVMAMRLGTAGGISQLIRALSNNTTEISLGVYSESNSNWNAYIYSNGNLVNRNNSYGALSDAKLKENIVDTTPKLADLMQVKVRNYNLIGDTTKQIGVVAQELETVFPAMVEESPDRDAEGNDLGTTTKGVKYSVFVPMLIKALQEQQAIIDSLKARLDAANL